ncbi:MAG TPA: sporulation membrane protein YtaF [Bacillota bacterium]|nr:sporulation membrane protein YtaF [Bacillota bacterium]
MHWLSILILGIASNLDNLGIGISFGIRSTKIPFFSNLIIAFISMVGTYLSMVLGSLLSQYVPHDVANFLGGFLIISIGIWTIASSLTKKNKEVLKNLDTPSVSEVLKDPSKADLDGNHYISMKESLWLGLALALNSIGTGIGAGASELSTFWTTAAVGVFSLLTIGIGVGAGLRISKSWICRYSDFLAGILLIGIGLYEIFI